LEPVFQPADAAQGGRPGSWAKERAEQPHAREAEAAEKGEPVPPASAARRPSPDEESALHHAPARAQHHVEAGVLAEPAANPAFGRGHEA
jgi:hypothetical protein